MGELSQYFQVGELVPFLDKAALDMRASCQRLRKARNRFI